MDGPFGSNLKTEYYTRSGPRVIWLQNIGEGVFLEAHAHLSDAHYQSLAKHHVHGGDVVIAALGNEAPRACLFPPSVGPAIVKADCIRFKPEVTVALPRYVNFALNHRGTKRRVAAIVHGVGRPRLNLSEIKAIQLPVPSLSEQHEIVRRVDTLFKLADAVEQRSPP